jgi:hypothetical protein
MADQNQDIHELLVQLQPYSTMIEAVLPTKARAAFHRLMEYSKRGRGPKPHDDRELLLAMAELDCVTPEDTKARQIAKTVVDRYPAKPGAGYDPRSHMELPDGSRPARKDLIERLEKKYTSQQARTRKEVQTARDLAARLARRLELIGEKGSPTPLLRDPRYLQRLREANRRVLADPPTAYAVDLILQTVRTRRRPS